MLALSVFSKVSLLSDPRFFDCSKRVTVLYKYFFRPTEKDLSNVLKEINDILPSPPKTFGIYYFETKVSIYRIFIAINVGNFIKCFLSHFTFLFLANVYHISREALPFRKNYRGFSHNKYKANDVLRTMERMHICLAHINFWGVLHFFPISLFSQRQFTLFYFFPSDVLNSLFLASIPNCLSFLNFILITLLIIFLNFWKKVRKHWNTWLPDCNRMCLPRYIENYYLFVLFSKNSSRWQ